MKKTIIALATLSPLAWAGVASAQGVTFDDIDADGSGELSYSEVTAVIPNMTMEDFTAADTDGNGSLSEAELQAVAQKNSGG